MHLSKKKLQNQLISNESPYDIICRISEKMKFLDLAKRSFNNPLLSFILDLN
ncbi:14104_t:CDS:2 [Funneliformis mosseae]|uniref:14104_t:CDS:1 n=1 Tax=Funneliformis mosseae TaxID=27381 RepID=A0A9N9DF01_FUNMO|nr:14104_t:CDS:2 [Funneliformis mosseae]